MKKKIIACLLAVSCLVGCGTDDQEKNEVAESNAEKEVLEEDNAPEEVDERYIYDDGKARLEPSSGTEAVAGFVEYIREHGAFDEDDIGYGTDAVFQLIYLDEDDIPELIYGGCLDGVHTSSIYILKYMQFGVTADDIVKAGPFGCYNMTSYYPYRNLICTSEPGHMGVTGSYYSTINEFGETERVAYSEDYYEDDDYETVSESHYYIGADEKEVSVDEYSAFIQELIGDSEMIQFDTYQNEDGYHYLDDEALNNNLYSDEFLEGQ